MSSMMEVDEFAFKLITNAPDFIKFMEQTVTHSENNEPVTRDFVEWVNAFSEWMQNGAPQYETAEKD